MKDILVLNDLDCIKAIAHPKRIDILNTFDELPLSAKQLSQLLDEPHAKINYHIKTLNKVGILELVEEKIKSGIVEKYYYPKAKHIIIGKKVLSFSTNNSIEDNKDLYMLKFESVINSFYNAVETHNISDENIINHNEIELTKSELKELIFSINEKIDDIKSKRTTIVCKNKYNIAMISIPLDKEVSNL